MVKVSEAKAVEAKVLVEEKGKEEQATGLQVGAGFVKARIMPATVRRKVGTDKREA